MRRLGEFLPQETLDAIRDYRVSIKGPLSTPVGGGIRSLNVTMRQVLDLFACVRPVRYFEGVPSPVKEPGKVDMVIYRENTEDVYAGIEWPAESEGARNIIGFLNALGAPRRRQDPRRLGHRHQAGLRVRLEASGAQSDRVRHRREARFRHARPQRQHHEVHRRRVQRLGLPAARDEFGDVTIPESEVGPEGAGGRIVIKDRIADSMFQQVLLRPSEYSVIATTNLNGDYLSDALAAQVGGLGMAPGSNESDEVAIFEATHGTAPKYAGKDMINPCSLILSGVMMLRHLKWGDAADAIERAIATTIAQKKVTYDLERQMEGATKVSTSDFGRAIVENI